MSITTRLLKNDDTNDNNYINTMLIHSSYRGLPNLTEALIKKGADVNYDSGRGYTPLFASFAFGVRSYGDRYKTSKTLIKYGADVNARDIKGSPAIVELSRRYMTDLVNLLIETGADITAKDKYGKNYKDYLSKFNKNELPIQK